LRLTLALALWRGIVRRAVAGEGLTEARGHE
jgi:hypothetical protein